MKCKELMVRISAVNIYKVWLSEFCDDESTEVLDETRRIHLLAVRNDIDFTDVLMEVKRLKGDY